MDFSDGVPSSVVCNWFYSFFIVYAVLTGLIVVALVYMLFFGRSLMNTMLSMRFFTAVLGLVFSGTNMLFFYIICKRSLKPESA